MQIEITQSQFNQRLEELAKEHDNVKRALNRHEGNFNKLPSPIKLDIQKMMKVTRKEIILLEVDNITGYDEI